MIVSTDGGASFNSAVSPAVGITTLNSLPPFKPHGWPVLPGGTFRVFTLPTACVLGQTVVVAWADYREGVSRIYYALSTNGGINWSTGSSGQPLLKTRLPSHFQHFHPQLIADPNGVIGCAFYEFGRKPNAYLIDVIMAESFDAGNSFYHFAVTDQPWNPTVDAPISLVDPIASFIGEYFGLDASSKGFYPLWTDTRTGIQELWTDIVPAKKGFDLNVPLDSYGQVAQILFGIIQGGDGAIFVNGHIIHIPPRGPIFDLAQAMVALDAVEKISGTAGRVLTKSVYDTIRIIAKTSEQRSRG